MHYFFLLISLFSFSLLNAQSDVECFIPDPKGRSLEHNVDMQSMDLSVSFNPEEGLVFGTVEYVFKCLQPQVDTLFLHAPGIDIKTVEFEGSDISFRTNEEGLIIEFPNTLSWGEAPENLNKRNEVLSASLKNTAVYEIKISYEAQPQKGIYFIGWNDETNRMRKQIWTQGQGIDNRHWIPGYDHQNDKLKTSMTVEFEVGYTIVSNGIMTRQNAAEGKQTVTYAMEKPHSSYLVMLAIGEFDVKVLKAKNGVPTYQYFYPGEEEKFEPTYQYSNEMMDWLEEELGVAYPWQKYANVPVSDFLYGAMENTSATIFTDYYFRDERGALDRNYIGTNAHELVHHWFGDLITAWGGTHHWLHESFATHYAKHFQYSIFGQDHFEWQRRGEMKSAWRANASNNKPIAHSQAGSSRHYPQGSIVLDMMRYVLGNEAYRAAIQHYLEKHAFGNVDSDDLRIAILERTGVNLDWFFKQWVYKGGHPKYEVNTEITSDSVIINVAQVHEINSEVDLFRMPVTVEVHFEDFSTKATQRVWIEKANHRLSIPTNGNGVAYVLFDPGFQILKEIEFPKGQDELMAQSIHAEHMIDRYDALCDLDSFISKEVEAHLIEIYDSQEFWAIRSEAVKQLAKQEGKKARKTLLAALEDEDHRVRRSAFNGLGSIKKSELKLAESLLTDPSYRNVSIALKTLSDSFPENSQQYLDITEGIRGTSHNVEISRLKVLGAIDSVAAMDRLTDLAGPSFEFRTRISAAKAMDGLNFFSEAFAKNLIDGCLSWNRRLASPMKQVTQNYLENENHRTIFLDIIENRQWTEDEQEKLDKLFKL